MTPWPGAPLQDVFGAGPVQLAGSDGALNVSLARDMAASGFDVRGNAGPGLAASFDMASAGLTANRLTGALRLPGQVPAADALASRSTGAAPSPFRPR